MAFGVALLKSTIWCRYYLAGRNYHGPAIAPATLSVWEQFTGVGKYYDPAADEEDRMRDLMEEQSMGEAGTLQQRETQADSKHLDGKAELPAGSQV